MRPERAVIVPGPAHRLIALDGKADPDPGSRRAAAAVCVRRPDDRCGFLVVQRDLCCCDADLDVVLDRGGAGRLDLDKRRTADHLEGPLSDQPLCNGGGECVVVRDARDGARCLHDAARSPCFRRGACAGQGQGPNALTREVHPAAVEVPGASLVGPLGVDQGRHGDVLPAAQVDRCVVVRGAATAGPAPRGDDDGPASLVDSAEVHQLVVGADDDTGCRRVPPRRSVVCRRRVDRVLPHDGPRVGAVVATDDSTGAIITSGAVPAVCVDCAHVVGNDRELALCHCRIDAAAWVEAPMLRAGER